MPEQPQINPSLLIPMDTVRNGSFLFQDPMEVWCKVSFIFLKWKLNFRSSCCNAGWFWCSIALLFFHRAIFTWSHKNKREAVFLYASGYFYIYICRFQDYEMEKRSCYPILEATLYCWLINALGNISNIVSTVLNDVIKQHRRITASGFRRNKIACP